MKREIKIGFDLDETIASHKNNIQTLAKKYLATETTVKTPEEVLNCLNHDYDKYRTFADELYGEMSLTADSMEDSVTVINNLHSEDVPIFIISRRAQKTHVHAREWINNHLPFIDEHDIFFVDADAEKGPLCVGLDVSLFLDNKKQVLKYLPLSVRPVLFDQFKQHNQTPYPRVQNWKEFNLLYKTIEHIEETGAPLCV